MGTRHLIAVYIDGEYKIAQYGQWDGYPRGQGVTCFEFIKTLLDANIVEEFKEKVRATQWMTETEIDNIDEQIDNGSISENQYPELSRDTGGKILSLVLEKPAGIKLINDITFAAASLVCEWVYVLDFDTNTFEVYKGFNKISLYECDRFYFLKDKEDKDAEYHGVKMLASWKLDELPSTTEEFLETFGESA